VSEGERPRSSILLLGRDSAREREREREREKERERERKSQHRLIIRSKMITR